MIVAKVEEENVIHLAKGKHKLQFIAVGNPEIKDSYEYKVEDVKESDYIEVFLKEKAGIISVEAKELESLKHERDELQKQLSELKNKLKLMVESFDNQTAESQKKLALVEDERKRMSETIKALQSELIGKDEKIKNLQTKLAESQDTSNKLLSELIIYKDKEQREKRAKEEAERKAREESERKFREAEAQRKASEEEKKRGIISVGDVEFKMIHVDGGTFTMGSTSNDAYYYGEKPVHQEQSVIII